MSDSHHAVPQPLPEPRTPMWLPAVGAALFSLAGLGWALAPATSPGADLSATTTATQPAAATPPPATPPPAAPPPAAAPRAAPRAPGTGPSPAQQAAHSRLIPAGAIPSGTPRTRPLQPPPAGH